MFSDYRHLSFPSMPSTNTYCVELAMSGDMGDVWVTCDSQTSGRARRGRRWVSESGNLYASLLLIAPSSDTLSFSSLPLVASVALHDAITTASDNIIGLSIKWPNDLLLNGKKVSGILLERGEDSQGRVYIVLGFGVNCRHHPPDTDYPATSLLSEGYDISPSRLFSHLVSCVSDSLQRWDWGNGISHFRDNWLSRSEGLGSCIEVRLPHETLQGIFEDLDSTGRLILRTPDTVRHISSGDVFFSSRGSV